MSKDVKPFGIPLVFEYSATHYCKLCRTWGTPGSDVTLCGNCGKRGYLMPNPFPDNMIPYVVLPEPSASDGTLGGRANTNLDES